MRQGLSSRVDNFANKAIQRKKEAGPKFGSRDTMYGKFRTWVRTSSQSFNEKFDKKFERHKKKWGVANTVFNAGIAAMAVGAMPLSGKDPVIREVFNSIADEWDRYVENQNKDKFAKLEHEMREERKRSIAETAPDFKKQIEKRKEVRKADMELVFLYGFAPDSKLGGVSKYEYVKNQFLANGSGTIPETIASQLRLLMPSLIAAESRYNTNAVSEGKAFGAVQATPSTFQDWYKYGKGKEIPPGKYEEYRKAFIEDFTQQVEFINWYVPYIYDRLLEDTSLAEELGNIQEKYFPSDEEGFERYFMTPVILNAYNAGFGTMEFVIEGIKGKVTSFLEKHPHSIPNHKYLAFYLLTEDTNFRNPKNSYTYKHPRTGKQISFYFDEEKHGYVREILAFDELTAEMVKNGGPEFQLASNTKKPLN